MNGYQNRAKILFAAFVVTACFNIDLNAQDLPLRGAFAGAGNDFSGVAFPIGGFTGVFDPGTATAEWTTHFGTLNNQTIRFDLIQEVYPNVFYYEQSVLFTGGSGFYDGANGSAEFRGFINLATGDFVGSINGVLTLN